MTTTLPPRTRRRAPRRTGLVLTGACVLLALCLGLRAPSVSPVAPAGPLAPVAQVVDAGPRDDDGRGERGRR